MSGVPGDDPSPLFGQWKNCLPVYPHNDNTPDIIFHSIQGRIVSFGISILMHPVIMVNQQLHGRTILFMLLAPHSNIPSLAYISHGKNRSEAHTGDQLDHGKDLLETNWIISKGRALGWELFLSLAMHAEK